MSELTGWWFVHMDDFNEGWIPATYLEPVYGVPSDGHQVQQCYSVSTLRTLFTKSSSVEFPTRIVLEVRSCDYRRSGNFLVLNFHAFYFRHLEKWRKVLTMYN